MDNERRLAVQIALAHDDASSNIELVEYLVKDVGISIDEAWDSVLHGMRKVDAAQCQATPQRAAIN